MTGATVYACTRCGYKFLFLTLLRLHEECADCAHGWDTT